MGGENSGRRREVDSALMIEALEDSQSMQEAALKIGCSAQLIKHRSGTEKAVQSAIRDQDNRVTNAIAESLMKNKGIVSLVAKDLELSVGSVNYRLARSSELQQVRNECREVVVDGAEANVFDQVEAGSFQASTFVLKTLGKDRGYTERRETDVAVHHSIDQAATGQLLGMLDQLVATTPEAVEAEFEVLEDDDKALLARALDRHSPKDEDLELVEEDA